MFGSSLQHAVTTPSVYGWAIDGVLSDTGDDLGEDEVLAAIESLRADPAFDAVAEIVIDLEITADGAPPGPWSCGTSDGHSAFVIAAGREPVGPGEVAVGRQTLDELGARSATPSP